ncbi:unnamed protein product [Linum trigynum]|uniref:Uncharacterized protein n=1 Tax=Linum trigynum TaxID=586398 RepID=A0AAV2CVI2_9ROSI
MVLTKSVTAVEQAAKAAQEQVVTAATTGLPSSDDGAHGVPSLRDGELEDDTEREAIRVILDRLVAAFETERLKRLAERREREEDSRRVLRRFEEVQEVLEALRGARPPLQKSDGGGAGASRPIAAGGSPEGGTAAEDLSPAVVVMETTAVAATAGEGD